MTWNISLIFWNFPSLLWSELVRNYIFPNQGYQQRGELIFWWISAQIEKMPRLDGKKLPRLEFRHIDRRTIREKDRFHYENNLSHLYFLLLWACVQLLPIIATFSAKISPIQTNVPIFINIFLHCKSLYDFCTKPNKNGKFSDVVC